MPAAKISRRRFLAITGVTLGATALGCSGLTVLGTRQPATNFPEVTLGETTMPDKILVAYASKAGSTGGVAEAIGKALAESGVQVDVRLMKDVTDLAPYRAVVAGSAIRMGQWLKEAMQFVETHQAALAQKPFAAFLVCFTLAKSNDEASRQEVAAYLEPVRALVKPASEGLFAGVVDFGKLRVIPEGLIMRAILASDKVSPGDYRDWDAIRTWAAGLKLALVG
jgi:menaquinone-dependent protoporphyrinogen oxidase